MTTHEKRKRLRMASLAEEFSLTTVPGFFPWLIGEDEDLTAVQDAFARASGGGKEAIRFVLSVWNRELPEYFGFGPFNVHDALIRWDAQKRRAFSKWAKGPWWC